MRAAARSLTAAVAVMTLAAVIVTVFVLTGHSEWPWVQIFWAWVAACLVLLARMREGGRR